MLPPKLSSAHPYVEKHNRMLPLANMHAVNIVILTDVCRNKLQESHAFTHYKSVWMRIETVKNVIHNELLFCLVFLLFSFFCIQLYSNL